MDLTKVKRYLPPAAAGTLGALFLAGLYFAIVSWAESLGHALELFWEDRLIVIPIILGFGVQVALYAVLKMHLYAPVTDTGASGALTGAGGGMSTLAMVACCAHHVTDVLPLVGLTAAATFLAEYRIPFMLVGLGTTILGIAVILTILVRERRRAFEMTYAPSEAV